MSEVLGSHFGLGKQIIQQVSLGSTKCFQCSMESCVLNPPFIACGKPIPWFLHPFCNCPGWGEKNCSLCSCDNDTYLRVPFKNQLGLLIFMCSHLTPLHRRWIITFQLHRVIVTQHCCKKEWKSYHNFCWIEEKFTGHPWSDNFVSQRRLWFLVMVPGILNCSWPPCDQELTHFSCSTKTWF